VRIVRGRADARWLPSRHDHALFRLYAYLRLRRARPEQRDVILIVDRHQSNPETWIVMSWLIVTMACYLAATLFARWPVPIAIAVSVPIAIVLMEVPLLVWGLTIGPVARTITRREDWIRFNSIVVMSLFTIASAYFATRPAWVRFVAWQFLGVLVLNGVAAVIVFALRGSIAKLEANVFGGATSAH
jgi:hypothetical protein